MSYTRRWYDTFNVSTPTGLTGHTPDQGGAYSSISSSGSPNVRADDTTKRLEGSTSGATWSAFAKPAATLTQGGGYILADITLLFEFASGSTRQTVRLGSSRSVDGSAEYFLDVGNSNGSNASFVLYRNGTQVASGTFAATLGTSFAMEWLWTPAGQHTVKVNGGAALIDWTDTSPLAPGGFQLGMHGGFDAAGRIVADNIEGWELDPAPSSGFGAGATLGAVVASGSLQSVMSGFSAGAALGAVIAGGSLGATPGTFVLGPIKVNGVAAAGAALDYVRIYSDAGVLLYERTGGSLDGTGSTTLSTSSAPPGTAVRIDWQLSSGRRRMPRVNMG